MQKSRKNYYHLWHRSQGWNSCQQTKVWLWTRFPQGYYVTIVYKLLCIKTTVSLQSPVPYDLQSQSLPALNSIALCGYPKLRCCNQRQVPGRVQAEKSESSYIGPVTVRHHPVHRPATMASIWHTFASHFPVYIFWSRAGLGCKGSTLCYSPRPSPLRADHFSPYAVLTPPSLSFISGVVPPPPAFLLPLPPSLPKALDLHLSFSTSSLSITALAPAPSSSVPIPVQEAQYCSIHMVLGAGCFQSFPSILPQCQQWEEWEPKRDNLRVLSSKHHSSPWR